MIVSYGAKNRTQMLRIPAAGRIEDRTVDGSCNPYLAATAVLAAGLDGIENGLDAGDPTTELNLHDLTEDQRKELGVELLPAKLLDATPSSSRTTCCAPRSVGRGTRTTWTTTSRRSRTSSRSGTTRSLPEIKRYLQLF